MTDVASLTQDIEPIPRVAPKPTRQRTRPPLGWSSALATEISLREIEKLSSKHDSLDYAKAMPAGNLDSEHGNKAKVHHP